MAVAGFRECAQAAGLNGYRWEAPGKRPLNILQTIGNGCAFFDFDNEGNLDILLVGPKVALYRGDGHGGFTDVSQAMGVATLEGHFLGCAVGDYDNDGYPDVYLTAYRGGALLHNEAGKGFKDVTKAAGIAPQPWATTATFFDANRDGHLDLYVGNYVQFGPDTDPQLCASGDIKTSCGPRYYDPEAGHLYLGSGNGTFRDGTQAAGITYLRKNSEAITTSEKASGKCLGVAAADFDGSGHISIALANDEMPGDLLRNTGRGRFENVGQASGTAYDANGGMHGGMGIDWGDVNNDGKLDLFVGTFQNEPKCLYINGGSGFFEERSDQFKLHAAHPLVTFGSKFFDFDNDGFLDLILANGHVQDNINEIDRSAFYRQPTLLFQNQGGQRFEDVSARLLDAGSRRPIVGRGLAVGDYDNDGRRDVLIVDSEGTPLLLHNEFSTSAGNRWVGFALSQPPGAPGGRDAYGAVVTVRAMGGRTRMRHCHADGSYMSSSDKRLHFGLGSAAEIESVTVRWPDGTTEKWPGSGNNPADGGLLANRYHRLVRGTGVPADTRISMRAPAPRPER